MKKKNYYVLIALLISSVLGFSGCSKEDVLDAIVGEKSKFTMKVDGKDWSGSLTTLFTEAESDSEQGEYYIVSIAGGKTDQRGEEYAETCHMYITIPASKFRNPKGRYPITMQTQTVDLAIMLFVTENVLWVGRNPSGDTQSVGYVEITDFKIGQQKVAGQSVGTEGYTQLEGTFNSTLTSADAPSGTNLKITDGKFNLEVGLMVNN